MTTYIFYSTNQSPLSWLEKFLRIKRFFTLILSFLLVSHVFLTPGFAKGVEVAKQRSKEYKKQSSFRLSSNLSQINEILSLLHSNKKVDKQTLIDNLQSLHEKIDEDVNYVLEEFQKEKNSLIEKKVPSATLIRHDKVVEHFKADFYKIEDKNTIKSYFPNGKVADISRLPSSFSGYLIVATPQLKSNEQSIIQIMVMGLAR